MTDQELADRVHDAVKAMNDARDAAIEAGLEVSITSFTGVPPWIAHVWRYVPAVKTDYPPTERGADDRG